MKAVSLEAVKQQKENFHTSVRKKVPVHAKGLEVRFGSRIHGMLISFIQCEHFFSIEVDWGRCGASLIHPDVILSAGKSSCFFFQDRLV